MGNAVKNNTSIGIEYEVTEGTYVAPSAASSFVQSLKDGTELSPSKEVLERDVFTSSIGKTAPLVGQSQVSGSIVVEAKANSTAGGAPEFEKLMKSALGDVRSISSTTTTKSSGNTDTVLQIEDADISKFNVGDIILVKASGAYHVSPITSKSTGTGSATITLLVAHPDGDMPDSVVIEKSTTYIVADSGHPSLSISRYLEGTILHKATGCKVTSMALENFTTGQIPSFNFGIEGLDYDESVTSIPYTPSYQSSRPPIILDAHLYQDGSEIDVNELAISVENTLAFKSAFSAENGRISSRATERVVTGSFNPFTPDDSVANFTKLDSNTSFSLFAYASVPTGSGTFDQIIAVYMPNCNLTEKSLADQDGLLQDALSFSANRGSGTTPEIYISFI